MDEYSVVPISRHVRPGVVKGFAGVAIVEGRDVDPLGCVQPPPIGAHTLIERFDNLDQAQIRFQHVDDPLVDHSGVGIGREYAEVPMISVNIESNMFDGRMIPGVPTPL